MTIKLRFGRKSKEQAEAENFQLKDPGPPALTTAADTIKLQLDQAKAYIPSMPPPPPPHPCEYSGHQYDPLAKSGSAILLFCHRCADVKRISLRAPLPPPSQPRFAHLA